MVIFGSPNIQFAGLLDEKHTADSITYELTHVSGLVIFEHGGLRNYDGSINASVVKRAARAMVAANPSMAMGLVPSPLGLASPIWIDLDGFEPGNKVRVYEGDIDADPQRCLAFLTGPEFELLDLSTGPWELVLFGLTDGRVALAVRFHHVLGDGLWFAKVIESLFDAATPDVYVAPTGGPKSGWTALPSAVKNWYQRQGSPRAAWREYRVFTTRSRVRRIVVRRWLRPYKEWMIQRKGLRSKYLPPRTETFGRLSMADFTSTAKRLDVSLSELLMVASLWGCLRSNRDSDQISLMMAVSHRSQSTTMNVRNHISMIAVSVESDVDLPTVLEQTRMQIRAQLDGTIPAATPPPATGYATYLAVDTKSGKIGGAPVDVALTLPVGDPRAPVSLLALSNGGSLTVSVSVAEGIDPSAVLHDVVAVLLGGLDVDSEQ